MNKDKARNAIREKQEEIVVKYARQGRYGSASRKDSAKENGARRNPLTL